MTHRIPESTPRVYATVAGTALLLMAVLAVFANFFVFENLIVPDDAAETARNIAVDEMLFRSGIAAFVVVAILDVLVAWGLYVFFRPVHRHLAMLAAWLRLTYTAVLAMALSHYLGVLQLLGSTDYSTPLTENHLHAQVMLSIDAFSNGWLLGLVLFGLHLLVVGYLMVLSGHMSKVIGALLMLASVGYLIDSGAQILLPNYSDYETMILIVVAVPGVVGEVSFACWLFLRGTRMPDLTPQRQSVSPQA